MFSQACAVFQSLNLLFVTLSATLRGHIFLSRSCNLSICAFHALPMLLTT